MSKKTNQFTAAYNSVFPQMANHKGSIYLTQNLIRKSVEQASWLISQKEKDLLVLHDDAVQLSSADQLTADGALVICAKYGAVRGAMHYDDIALDRCDERITNLEVEIEMLQQFIDDNKDAFKDCTGDTYQEKKAAPKQEIPADRKAALRAKYAA
jgi:hypothetical protein